MLKTSGLVRIATLSSLIAVGCGGSVNALPGTGQDASTGTDSGAGDAGVDVVGRPDGTADTGAADAAVDSARADGAADTGAADTGAADTGAADVVVESGSADDASDTGSPGTGDGGDGGNGASCATSPDGTPCDDGNPCTQSDVCTGGTCAGDGTGVVVAGCQPADLCTSFHCAGDKAGSCNAVPLVDCSSMSDQCHAGTCDSTSGSCVKQARKDGTSCQTDACTVGTTCTSGACGGGTARSCDDKNPCTDDSCDTTLGCLNKSNTATCDDGNPCTVSDLCAGGTCQGAPMDCSAQNDACNTGTCNAGTCGKTAKADGTACDDGLACNTTDACTGGVCKGSGKSCGPNSSACAEGPPKVCTCNSTYVSTGGQCVPSGDPCAATPCVANATCTGPSTCSCPTGFTGDGTVAGTGCTNNSCAGNPCGAGTCVTGINTHTCNCNAGYVSVNGVCVCDMNGTFAVEANLTTSWSGVTFFENGTNVPSTSWAIRTQSYDSAGSLVIQTTQCGGTSMDLCGQGNPVINPDEAYGQFLPGPIFGLSSMPTGTLTISLPNALPGQAYQEPQTAVVFGVSLTDPLGAWPAANTNIGAGANQTNGAVWVDHDSDGHPGVTSYAVPPGGVSSSTSPFPTRDYAATSTACPRRSASLARLSYNYLPGVENFTLERVKRLYTAQRVISSMSGTISSCDSTGATLVQGTLGGPDNGQVQANLRVGGCVRVNGTGEIDCSSTLTNEYDNQSQPQHVTSGNFIIKRVANTVTCADVRAMTYP